MESEKTGAPVRTKRSWEANQFSVRRQHQHARYPQNGTLSITQMNRLITHLFPSMNGYVGYYYLVFLAVKWYRCLIKFTCGCWKWIGRLHYTPSTTCCFSILNLKQNQEVTLSATSFNRLSSNRFIGWIDFKRTAFIGSSSIHEK